MMAKVISDFKLQTELRRSAFDSRRMGSSLIYWLFKNFVSKITPSPPPNSPIHSPILTFPYLKHLQPIVLCFVTITKPLSNEIEEKFYEGLK